MNLFRVRLILALIASVTLVSLASTYFDVLAHRHTLREDLERRTKWMGMSIEPDVHSALASQNPSALPPLAQLLKNGTGALGLAIYDVHGDLLASSGPPDVMSALGLGVVEKSMQRGVEAGAFGHAGQWQWLEEVFPVHNGNQLEGAMAIVVDASYIRSEGIDLWRRSFWRIVVLVILIVAVTIGMVRWFLLRPMRRAAERLHHLRISHPEKPIEPELPELGLFSPLAREVETMVKEFREAEQKHIGYSRLRDSEVLQALVFLLRMGMSRTSGRPKSRAYVDFLFAQFPEAQSPIATPDSGSRLIVP